MTFDDFLSRLDRVKRRGDGATARCPAHEDKNPSLGVKRGHNGTPLFTCYAGCSKDSILDALGLTWREVLGDGDGDDSAAFRSGGGRSPAPLKVRREAEPREKDETEWVFDTAYHYTDEAGETVYIKERYASADGRKKFLSYRPDGKGGKIYKLDGVRRVPYNLKELAKARETACGALQVVLVEGEKDCDNLAGLMALDTLCQRGVWVSSLKDWEDSFNAYIGRADVSFLRDHDLAGLTQAEGAAAIVSAAAKSLKIIDLFEGEPEQGQDVSDWIANLKRDEGLGNEDIIERVLEIIRTAPTWRDPVSKSERAGGLEIEYLSNVTPKAITWFCEPFIPNGVFTIIDGIEGIGKTTAMLDLAKRLTLGEPMPFRGDRHEPSNVLLLSVEDSPEYVLRPRFERLGGDLSRCAILKGNFVFSDAGFERLERTIEAEAVKFIVIDPLFSFTGNAEINQSKDVKPITDGINRIAAKYGIAFVGIRHIGKAKGFGEARSAGGHAIAWLQGARAGAIIGHDVEDKSKRAIIQHKINVAAECKTAYGFEIDGDGVFRWIGESDLTLDRMLSNKGNATSEDRSALAEASRFLTDQLKHGEKSKWEIDEAARGAGISLRSLERAKPRLGIKAFKKEMAGRWYWKLPEDRQDDEDRQDFP